MTLCYRLARPLTSPGFAEWESSKPFVGTLIDGVMVYLAAQRPPPPSAKLLQKDAMLLVEFWLHVTRGQRDTTGIGRAGDSLEWWNGHPEGAARRSPTHLLRPQEFPCTWYQSQVGLDLGLDLPTSPRSVYPVFDEICADG